MGLINFFKKAFADMKKSAAAQHEVDRAEFEAVKAESRASFESNRGRNTFARAKADAKKHWDDAHMSSAERAERTRTEQQERIANAKAREDAANERYNELKK